MATTAVTTRAHVRKVRTWMLLLMLTPICLFVVCFLVWGTGGPSEPSVRPANVPAGFKAVSDVYYGYSIPSDYNQQTTWTDQTGDWFYGTPSSFVAESLSSKTSAPTVGESPPVAFHTSAISQPEPLLLSDPQRIQASGIDVAWQYQAARSGGWKATVVEVWSKESGPRMWLMIHGSRDLTSQVLASVRGAGS